MKLQKPKPLSVIFDIPNPNYIEHELGIHCSDKRFNLGLPLSHAEAVFDNIKKIGRTVAGDGFISLYVQFFTPESFPQVCDALTEVGAFRLRDLLREAWSIYTRGKEPITLDELQRISVRRFNTKEKMDRFDEIGLEVEAELQEQYQTGRVWSVEYAKRHRAEFTSV